MRLRYLPVILLLAGPLVSQPAWSVVGDFFRPKISYAYEHDSNLFRLPSSLVGDSENYQTLGAGFDLDWKQGRQEVLASVLLSETRFDRYDSLDYQGQNLSARWNWVFGNRLSGSLALNRAKTLGSYQDIQQLIDNVRTDNNVDFSTYYLAHPRWQLFLGLSRSGREYSASALEVNDFENDTVQAGLFYLGGEMRRLGVLLRNLHGEYLNRLDLAGSPTSYDEQGISFVADYDHSGKTSVNMRIGLLTRDDEGSGRGDYDGWDGRITGNWTPTGKTNINLALYGEVGNSENAAVNREKRTGLNMSASWRALPKTTAGAYAMFERRDTDLVSQDSHLTRYGLNASYQPWLGADLSVNVERQNRSSDNDNLEYGATVLGFRASMKF